MLPRLEPPRRPMRSARETLSSPRRSEPCMSLPAAGRSSYQIQAPHLSPQPRFVRLGRSSFGRSRKQPRNALFREDRYPPALERRQELLDQGGGATGLIHRARARNFQRHGGHLSLGEHVARVGQRLPQGLSPEALALSDADREDAPHGDAPFAWNEKAIAGGAGEEPAHQHARKGAAHS